MDIGSYKDLVVWQRAMELTSLAYQFSLVLPADERFGLTSQLRTAAVSVPANIAEGRQRTTTKDFLRFLSIAAGSLAELETLIELAGRLYQFQSAQVNELAREADEVGKLLRALPQRLEAKLPSP